MRKLLATLALTVSITTAAQAQGYDGDLGQQSVKLNLSSLGTTTISGFYERYIGAKTSVQGGLRYTLPRNLGFIDDNSKASGFAVTGEFRYSLGETAGKGFYVGGLARYERFTVNTKLTSTLNNGSAFDVDLKGLFGGPGAGFQTGVQWILGDHFVIDWMILGVYLRSAKTGVRATSASFGLTAADLQEINQDLSDAYSSSTFLKSPTYVVTNQEISVFGRVGIPGLRTGLCLGYRF